MYQLATLEERVSPATVSFPPTRFFSVPRSKARLDLKSNRIRALASAMSLAVFFFLSLSLLLLFFFFNSEGDIAIFAKSVSIVVKQER